MGKRYRSNLSIEEIEKEVYILRIENIEQRIKELKQAKDVYNKVKELVELKKWAQEYSISIQGVYTQYIESKYYIEFYYNKKRIN